MTTPTPHESRGRIVVGVTGSIAAIKAPLLVSQLVQHDYEVIVILTDAASKMVTRATYQALTGGPVIADLWSEIGDTHMGHLEAADDADLFVIAPATANFLGKHAAGIADDALTTALLACVCPVLIAPAMNPRMWDHPFVQRNVATLRDLGHHFIGPEEGRLAEGVVGEGRMTEPAEILDEIERLLD